MLELVQKDQYERIGQSKLMQSLNDYLYLNINPILNQSFNGQIWCNDLDNPEILYVYDNKKAHFLLGNVTENSKTVTEFVETYVTPIIRKAKNGSSFILRDNWESINKIGTFEFFKSSFTIPRQLYKYITSKSQKIDLLKLDLPEELTVVDVSENLLNMNLKNLERLKAELEHMWGNVDNFFKFGFGTCALSGDSLAGLCLGEYISHGTHNLDRKMFGIGIETFPEFQNKGIAVAMTNAVVKKGLEKGYQIYWDCARSNEASIKTALKAGFELIYDYEILFVPPFQ